MRGKLTKFGQYIIWGNSMSKIAQPWSGTVGGQGPAKSNRHTNKVLTEAKHGVSGRREHVPPNLNQKRAPVGIHDGMRIQGKAPNALGPGMGLEMHTINQAPEVFNEAARLGKGPSPTFHGTGPSMASTKSHATAGTRGAAMGMRQRNPVSNMAREGGKPKLANENVGPGWMMRNRKSDKPNGGSDAASDAIDPKLG